MELNSMLFITVCCYFVSQYNCEKLDSPFITVSQKKYMLKLKWFFIYRRESWILQYLAEAFHHKFYFEHWKCTMTLVSQNLSCTRSFNGRHSTPRNCVYLTGLLFLATKAALCDEDEVGYSNIISREVNFKK